MHVTYDHRLASGGGGPAYALAERNSYAGRFTLERANDQLGVATFARAKKIKPSPIDVRQGIEQQRSRVGGVGYQVLLTREQAAELVSEARVIRVLVAEVVALAGEFHWSLSSGRCRTGGETSILTWIRAPRLPRKADYARSVGNASTSSMWSTSAASISVLSNPNATPAHSGSPASSAASNRPSISYAGSPRRCRSSLSRSKRARCSGAEASSSKPFASSRPLQYSSNRNAERGSSGLRRARAAWLAG